MGRDTLAMEMDARLRTAQAFGVDIGVMPLPPIVDQYQDGRVEETDVVAVTAPGQFLVLPENLNAGNCWFYGTREKACAFIEGLIMGVRHERSQVSAKLRPWTKEVEAKMPVIKPGDASANATTTLPKEDWIGPRPGKEEE